MKILTKNGCMEVSIMVPAAFPLIDSGTEAEKKKNPETDRSGYELWLFSLDMWHWERC